MKNNETAGMGAYVSPVAKTVEVDVQRCIATSDLTKETGSWTEDDSEE